MTRPLLDPNDPIVELLESDTRYHFDAYVFVFEALQYAQQRLELGESYLPEDADDPDEVERHVTGQELCEAIRQYALEQYGLAAQSVLDHWGVHSTGDFGEIVFNLIDIGKMKKTEHDRREDFNDVFDFDESLRQAFKITIPKSSEGHWA